MGSRSKKKNKVSTILKYIVIFSILGFIIGYFIFGKSPITQEYLNVFDLMGISEKNIIMKSIDDALFDSIREKILLSGGGGAIVGIILAALKK